VHDTPRKAGRNLSETTTADRGDSFLATLYKSRLLSSFRPLLRSIKRSPITQGIVQSRWQPTNWRKSLRVFRLLAFEYGHLHSVAAGRCLDGVGAETPWYTYPAIEFLRQLDFSDKAVFEFGSGNSTLFWGRLAREVTSVEDVEAWHEEISSKVPSNCRLLLQTDLEEYVKAIDSFDMFDVIVVDGPARGLTRLKCARAALPHLREGGMIILDNSDWLPQTSAFLREAGLLQVDMAGFGPINDYTWTTSFYFDRRWEFTSRHGTRPVPSTGAIFPQNYERGDDLIAQIEYEAVVRLNLGGAVRTFKLVGYRAGENQTALAILDEDRRRVLLSEHHAAPGRWPGRHGSQESEAGRIQQMTSSEFIAFINGHDQRRYTI
jgi:hypothetical protein